MKKIIEFIKYAIKCYMEINARNPYSAKKIHNNI